MGSTKSSPNLGIDLVQPFQLESSQLRGRVVRLGPVLDLILHQHAYPKPVAALLAEAIALAATLGTALKYEGVFTLQVKSSGIVNLLVVDITNDGGIRGYAQYDDEKLAKGNTHLLGDGYLAFTVDQQVKADRYQGIVKLEGSNLAEAVQHYFRQSEQIPTGIIAAATCDEHQRWHAGCLLLQRMPREGGYAVASDTGLEDDWYRAMLLMQTCTKEELTEPNIESDVLLYRLFHEEGVRVYDPLVFRHECRCSSERVTDMLRSLPRLEVEQLAVNDVVSVNCEFCNRTYNFNAKQRAALYDETDQIS